jgi:hypothetical protein
MVVLSNILRHNRDREEVYGESVWL